MTMIEEIAARQELKQLVDTYANESDKNNQDATGTCYALAHLVNEKDGADMLTTHAVRYEDRYVRTAAGWRIAAREQYFMFSDTHALGK